MPKSVLLWSPLPALLAAAAAAFFGGSAGVIALALVAGFAVALLFGALVARPIERRAEALAAAARGVQLEPAPSLLSDPDDPNRLAQTVKETQASAREMEKQLATLRAVVDGMAEGVWITGDDGTIIQHNNAIKEMLYAGQQIMGQRPASLLRSDDLQLAVERACREGVSTRLELPIEGVRPRVVSIHISPLGRELAGSAAVFFDVTELRRLEKIRKDFVANVSHELRTPITAIRGYAETLKSGALADALNAPRMVDIIYRQSERLSELVEDLLELSRIDARQIQLQEKPIELEKATLRAAETVRPKALTKQIAVEVAIAPGLQVIADERALDQVLLNLLDNAVKYTPSGGHVRVTAKDFASTVELSVKDNGAGIEARHLPRIFERFYRVDKGRSRDMGGTGLGLSIVKNLVTLMKGDVRVHSAPAEGSTFFVTLPRPGAELPAPVPGDEAPKVQLAE